MEEWSMDMKGPKKDEDEDGWLMTYGDMMSLILCFFIMIAAMSSVNVDKYKQVAQSMANAMGADVQEIEEVIKEAESEVQREGEGGMEEVTPPEDPLQQLVQELSPLLSDGDDIEMELTERGLAISIRGGVVFPSGSAELLPEAKSILNRIAESIKGKGFNVTVEGHTDNVPINTRAFPSNWELSAARASRVVRHFIEEGYPKRELKAVGYGDAKPILPNTTPEGLPIAANQSRNRRVVILIEPPNGRMILPPAGEKIARSR